MPMLGLSLQLPSVVLLDSPATIEAAPPPGTLDFSKEQNSALLILLEDI